MDDFLRLLWPLLLTILIEYPIVQIIWLLVKKDEKSKLTFYKNKIIIIPALIVNILTNPAINLFARYLWKETHLSDDTVWIILTLTEFIVWAAEAILYKFMLNTKWSKAFLLAISANFVSYMSSFLL